MEAYSKKSQYTTAFIAAALLSVFSQAAIAQNRVVRIEEDWQLEVTQPDEGLDAPQVTITMAPFASQPDLLLQIDLNHGSSPSFSNGGIQVRACIDDACLAQARVLSDERLHHESETINWTQVVQLSGNDFYFWISHGSGETWGEFGGAATSIFVAHANFGGNISLDGYEPQSSIDNSGVTYASNRVGHLRLKKFRVHLWNGQVNEYTLNTDVL